MQTCPVCQAGVLEEVLQPERRSARIRCSKYPQCRFEALSWDVMEAKAARFHHPVAPGYD